MKIATWNINSVRLRIDLLKKLAEEHKPDVIALQETKVIDSLFPLDGITALGYKHLSYAGEKSYNGVAILSKFPIEKSFALNFYNNDKRHIAAMINGVEVHNLYVPAGGDIPDINTNPKFKHKLEYLAAAKAWFKENRVASDKMVLLGDLNIAPHEHDVWSSTQLKNVVSHTAIERKTLIDLQDSLSWIDSARHFVPMEQKLYTWWSYRNIDWQKSNRGRRLDHIWVSSSLGSQMKSIKALTESRNWTKPSDHVPYILEL